MIEQKEKVETVKPSKEDKERLLAERKKLFVEIFIFIRKEQPLMTAKYRNSIRQVDKTSNMLTESMIYAYTKAFNDVIKLLVKESNNEESI